MNDLQNSTKLGPFWVAPDPDAAFVYTRIGDSPRMCLTPADAEAYGHMLITAACLARGETPRR